MGAPDAEPYIGEWQEGAGGNRFRATRTIDGEEELREKLVA